ncbi:basic secretory protein-like protein [Rufibacter latericius]|uniref:Secretory protein n=1 Tax=Rufibacter latericius TaxID=2487040 RepID=A0A3M9N0X1_9BACT|nr:basic secretory protein-like protein [Rufibacter latericius]RNI31432.1 secretory protein [Rufibacter latericius]
MKRFLIGSMLVLGSITGACAQGPNQEKNKDRIDDWTYIGNYISKDSITKGPYTLLFYNRDQAFAQEGEETKKRMIDAFFKVYPKEAARFNPNTTKKVTFIIDPAYQGVAAASDGIIRYSPLWMLQNPNDIDVVTHEVFHLVQAYPHDAGPGWLTEGITDYVRYKFGVDNAGGGWSLTPFKPEHHYTNSYRITGRFLAWLEKNKNPKIVDSLDAALRKKTYTPELWVKLTGKTVDELWQQYALNPAL